MNKWEEWWDNLSPHTKEYLKHQPIWKHDEMIGGIVGGLVVGFLIGLLF